MSEMEQFLLQLPCLKHLELQATVVNDVPDGYQWQVLAASLRTFYFKFYVSLACIRGTLNTFCTPFWLEEKRWFVAYDGYSLFSIPHFAQSDIKVSQPLSNCSTAPDNTFLYNHVRKITMTKASSQYKHYFTGIQTLELECSLSLKTIGTVTDLNRVTHLIIPSVDNLSVFIPLKCTMPQLYKLTVPY